MYRHCYCTAKLYHLKESQLSSVKSIGTSLQTPHSWRLHRKWPFASNTNCGRCCFLLQKLQGGVIETNSSIWHDQNWILRVKKQGTSDFCTILLHLGWKKTCLVSGALKPNGRWCSAHRALQGGLRCLWEARLDGWLDDTQDDFGKFWKSKSTSMKNT